MKNIIIFILLISIFLLISQENFNPVTLTTPKSFINLDPYYTINNFNSNINTTSIYENRFNFIPTTINDKNLVSNIDSDQIKSNKCCLVKKMLDNDNFKYEYTKYENENCNLNNFELDQNNQLLFDGVNGWSNDYCSPDTSTLGSCQHYNFECIDFTSKNKCDEYNSKMPSDPQDRKITYDWSKKPCYNK
jgi:hypothetical protein